VTCFSGIDAMDCLRACEVDSAFLSHADVPSLLSDNFASGSAT
jgi:hypothetical protein